MAHRTGVDVEMIVDYRIALPIIILPLRSNNIQSSAHQLWLFFDSQQPYDSQ